MLLAEPRWGGGNKRAAKCECVSHSVQRRGAKCECDSHSVQRRGAKSECVSHSVKRKGAKCECDDHSMQRRGKRKALFLLCKLLQKTAHVCALGDLSVLLCLLSTFIAR